MNPQSRARIVRWMLEEVEADYEVKLINYGLDMKSDAYLAINPMGKVPAIKHRDKIVTECAAICAYLADVFPEKKLAPDLTDRSQYYRWLFFAAGPLESAVMNEGLGFEVPEDKQRMAGYGNYDLVADVLAKKLTESDFICGDSFTAADVYVGLQVGWGVQFGTLPKRKEFIDYFERINKRPAFIQANKLDDKMISK